MLPYFSSEGENDKVSANQTTIKGFRMEGGKMGRGSGEEGPCQLDLDG